MHSGLVSAGVNMARPEGAFPEARRQVKRRMCIPNWSLCWTNTATTRLCHIRARAKETCPLSPVVSLSDLPQVSFFGQSQQEAKNLRSPLKQSISVNFLSKRRPFSTVEYIFLKVISSISRLNNYNVSIQ